MIFTKLETQPNDDVLLTSRRDLAHMPDSQFKDEVRYWQGVRKIGGFLQLSIARAVLHDVMENVDLLRTAELLPPQVQAQHAGILDELFVTVLPSVATAHFLRRAFDREMSTANYGTSQRVLGVELRLDSSQSVGQVHIPKGTVEDRLPSLDPDKPLTWYESDTLVLSASTPATPTDEFRESFYNVGKKDFVPEDFVTVRPQLKQSYIQHA